MIAWVVEIECSERSERNMGEPVESDKNKLVEVMKLALVVLAAAGVAYGAVREIQRRSEESSTETQAQAAKVAEATEAKASDVAAKVDSAVAGAVSDVTGVKK